ncbi:hypothetical protein Fmac_032950 [Flemingia macrophylla]|uniref:Uncharacterized protein n=1 Tax=Flemingia macrophylla TaxID=520843 RepID=A0ABD1L6D7_9FABA
MGRVSVWGFPWCVDVTEYAVVDIFDYISKVVGLNIHELIKQRDLSQSRVEDLLRMVGNDQKSSKERMDTWEDDDSISESSSIYRSDLPLENSTILTITMKTVKVVMTDNIIFSHMTTFVCTEIPDEYCKEVRCLELEESSKDDLEYHDPSISGNMVLALPCYGEQNVIIQEIPTPVNEDREERQDQDNATNGVLESRLDDAQLSNESPLAIP